jgi:hypothetical protein
MRDLESRGGHLLRLRRDDRGWRIGSLGSHGLKLILWGLGMAIRSAGVLSVRGGMKGEMSHGMGLSKLRLGRDGCA